MRQIIKLCNEITGEIKERRERMMMKRMWYELNILCNSLPFLFSTRKSRNAFLQYTMPVSPSSKGRYLEFFPSRSVADTATPSLRLSTPKISQLSASKQTVTSFSVSDKDTEGSDDRNLSIKTSLLHPAKSHATARIPHCSLRNVFFIITCIYLFIGL